MSTQTESAVEAFKELVADAEEEHEEADTVVDVVMIALQSRPGLKSSITDYAIKKAIRRVLHDMRTQKSRVATQGSTCSKKCAPQNPHNRNGSMDGEFAGMVRARWEEWKLNGTPLKLATGKQVADAAHDRREKQEGYRKKAECLERIYERMDDDDLVCEVWTREEVKGLINEIWG